MFAFAGPVEQPVLRDGGHIIIYYDIFCWPVEQSASLSSEMEDTYNYDIYHKIYCDIFCWPVEQ